MPATVHVIARYVARPGQESALKAVLTALLPPSRREIGCYQYDLLVVSCDARQLRFVERRGDDRALEAPLQTPHVAQALQQVEALAEGPPAIQRFTLV